MVSNQSGLIYDSVESAGGISNQGDVYAEAPSTAWDSYTQRWIATNDGVTLTTSVVSNPSGGPPASVMQITSAGGVAHSEHREFILRPDQMYLHGEIRSIVYGGTPTGGSTQQGHVHAWQRTSNGYTRAFVAWHDAIFGQTNLINLAVWESNGSTLNLIYDIDNTPGTHYIPIAPAPVLPVTQSSRNGSNVVTIIVPGAHDIQVGEAITTNLPFGSLSGTSVTVTAVTGPTITYTLNGAAAADGGGGTVQKVGSNVLNNCPYVFASRVLPGGLLQAKLWRLGFPEVPWSVGQSATIRPEVSKLTGPGMHGVLGAHMGAGQIVKYGLPRYTRLSQ